MLKVIMWKIQYANMKPRELEWLYKYIKRKIQNKKYYQKLGVFEKDKIILAKFSKT